MRGHISLQVNDVPRSVAFYERIFGIAPQKQTGRYAKFDVVEPPLNFSLVAGSTPSRVGHLGIEATSAEEFQALETRLRGSGIALREQAGQRCCYAVQDKLWFADPDGNAWEVFRVHEQLPVEADADTPACGPGTGREATSGAGAGAACCG